MTCPPALLVVLLTFPLAVGLVSAAETYYEILEVSTSSSPVQIKRSYYRLAKNLHPDRVEAQQREVAHERFQRLGRAYAVLSDPDQRRVYDQQLMLQQRNERATRPHTSASRGTKQSQPQQSPPSQAKPPAHESTSRSRAKYAHDTRQPKHYGQPPRPSAGDATAHALARKRLHEVNSISDLLDLTEAAHNGVINRHVLLAYYDSRDPSCPSRLLSEDDAAGGIGFPYPFAHQTQAWYGVWWEDVLIAASYDVAAALGPTTGTSTFGGAESPLFSLRAKLYPLLIKRAGMFYLPACPLFGFYSRGSRLTDAPRLAEPVNLVPSAANLQKWVWSQLEATVNFVNELGEDVRVHWIHGNYVNPLLNLGPKERTSHSVFLTHTLQAELPSRKGTTISENSSLAVFRVLSDGATFVISPTCIDFDSTCEFWREKGECSRNPSFMRTECARSCGACAEVERTNTPQPTSDCYDVGANCARLVAAGECEINLAFMREQCRLSCRLCPSSPATPETSDGLPRCADETHDCSIWSRAGECASNREFMMESCPRSCGFCTGIVGEAKNGAAVEDVNSAARCVDDDLECTAWADNGQCTENRRFMEVHCPRSCGFCQPPCEDLSDDCSRWAVDGWCERNWKFMRSTCRSACGACGDGGLARACRDMQVACEDWAKAGECTRNVDYMKGECPRACGLCATESVRQTGGKSNRRTTTMAKAADSVGSRSSRGDGREQAHTGSLRGDRRQSNSPNERQGAGTTEKACKDDIDKCAEIVQTSHTACKAPLMKSSCAKTCGVCRDSKVVTDEKGAPKERRSTSSKKAKKSPGRHETPGKSERGESARTSSTTAGKSVCIDRIPNCAAVIAKSPDACNTAPLMKTGCEKSCGICGRESAKRSPKDEL